MYFANVVKASVDAFAQPLTYIIKLTTGTFPNKINFAKIIPILKDDKHDLNNYRSISLLLSISKVFKKNPDYTKIYQHFKNNYASACKPISI